MEIRPELKPLEVEPSSWEISILLAFEELGFVLASLHTLSTLNLLEILSSQFRRERKKREYLWEATGTIIGAWYQRRKLHLYLSLMDDKVIMLQAQIGKYQDTCIFFFYKENWNPEATRYIINFDKLYVTQSVEFWLWICLEF